ncbi:alpha/beta fold hydrolase [Pseudonocardia phyllosphaerae]|uniref:alpha/beta fold hydrolase n=1 Tax=Pseudonocardia phyllosphaerae TaxID=3390502 RepID=UPI00397C25AF
MGELWAGRGTGGMRRRCAPAVFVLLLALLAGCSVGPSIRPPVAVRGEDLPAPPAAAGPAQPEPADPDALPPSEPVRSGPEFTDCTAPVLAGLKAAGTAPPAGRVLSVGCGRLSVPADRTRPDLGPARLGLTRVTQRGAAPDLPALVVVGDTGTDGSARAAATLAARLPADVLKHYQVIGMDRRGSGEDLLDCGPPDARAALVDARPTDADEAAMTRLLERSRSIVQDCYLLLSGTLTDFRAASTADDLESLRSALGTLRLDVVGTGDGADATATWLARHPEAAGRVVLDGPTDPSVDGPARAEAATAAAEGAFDAFAEACTEAGSCPLGADPRAAVTGLVARLGRTALPLGDGDSITSGAVLHAVRGLLPQPARWPELAAALGAANRGDPAGLERVLGPLAGPRSRFDGALATRCNDSRVRTTPGEGAALAGQWRGRYPLFGVVAAQDLVTCGPWPSGGPETPGAPAGAGPPVLVVGTAHDPRAPQAGAEQTARRLGTGRLVRWEGAGTGAYPRTPCVTAVVGKALVGGRAPADDVVCPP